MVPTGESPIKKKENSIPKGRISSRKLTRKGKKDVKGRFLWIWESGRGGLQIFGVGCIRKGTGMKCIRLGKKFQIILDGHKAVFHGRGLSRGVGLHPPQSIVLVGSLRAKGLSKNKGVDRETLWGGTGNQFCKERKTGMYGKNAEGGVSN